MVYTLACRDTGEDCDFVAKGATKEELMQIAGKHAIEVHKHTKEELEDPKFMENIMPHVKEE